MKNDYGKGRGAHRRIAKAAHADEWNRAIAEGRMVNFGDSVRPYLTREAAQLAVESAERNGVRAFIVPPALAR